MEGQKKGVQEVKKMREEEKSRRRRKKKKKMTIERERESMEDGECSLASKVAKRCIFMNK